MSSAQSGSTVLQDPSPRLIGASFGRVAVIAVLLAYGALALYHLGVPDLDADEGRYGTSALNILNDYHQIAIVSPDPGGVPWSTWPYAYPSLLAGSIVLLGKTEFALRLVNVVLMLLTALCIYRLAVLLIKDRTIALLAFGLFLLNPPTIAYARSAMAEPSVVFWGCAAMVAAASYRESGRPVYAALSGVTPPRREAGQDGARCRPRICRLSDCGRLAPAVVAAAVAGEPRDLVGNLFPGCCRDPRRRRWLRSEYVVQALVVLLWGAVQRRVLRPASGVSRHLRSGAEPAVSRAGLCGVAGGAGLRAVLVQGQGGRLRQPGLSGPGAADRLRHPAILRNNSAPGSCAQRAGFDCAGGIFLRGGS